MCDANIHTPLISEIPPKSGLTLSDPSGQNALRVIYQYGVPAWTFPLVDSEDQLVVSRQGDRGRLAVLKEGRTVRLQLLFFKGQARYYTVTGSFDRDFYDQNETLIRRECHFRFSALSLTAAWHGYKSADWGWFQSIWSPISIEQVTNSEKKSDRPAVPPVDSGIMR